MDFKPFKIGKYLLLERLATGGMAEVYRAKASGAGGFEKQLAIKRILPSYSQNDEFRRMFEYEARLSSMLTHANIVQVYDFTKAGETYLLAMEYVDGKNLRQLVNKTRKANIQLPVEFCVFVINEVLKGLEYAHKKRDDLNGKQLNIIHRDMSPQNIMLSYEGAVKIVDFGIAKAKDRVDETRSGVIKGKFGYMSPEQANGESVDHRTDIFSTGIILFELLTGKRLFAAESDMATLKQIQECVIPTPSRLNPKITADLEKIVLKGLTKDLKLRFNEAGVFHRAMLEFLNKNYPAFTQREVSEILQKAFKEEIENEKKRFEQIYRQSIPFSQGSVRDVPDDLGSIEEALEGSMTRSEIGAKTSVTSADGDSSSPAIPSGKSTSSSDGDNSSRPDATQVSLSMSDLLRVEDPDVSSGGDTQLDPISPDSTGERTLDKPAKRKEQKRTEKEDLTDSSIPAPGEEFLMPKAGAGSASKDDKSDVSSLVMRNTDDESPPEPKADRTGDSVRQRDLSVIDNADGAGRTDKTGATGKVSKKTSRRREHSVIAEVSQTNAEPDLRSLKMEPSDVVSSDSDFMPLSSGTAPRQREKFGGGKEDFDYDDRPRKPRRLFHPVFSLMLFAGLTGFLYHLYIEGQVPTLIEMIQPREPTNSDPDPNRPLVPTTPDASATTKTAPPVQDTQPALEVRPMTGACTIQVTSDPPGATVQIGKEMRGLAPATLSAPCNQAIDITLSLDGYESISENRFLKNSVEKMYKTLKKMPMGRLELTVNQNAKVYIDGSYVGEVSAKSSFEKNLRAGKKYRIRVVNEIFGIETTEEVSVAEDVVVRRTIRLQDKDNKPRAPTTAPRKKRR